MPKTPSKKIDTEVDDQTNGTNPEVLKQIVPTLEPLGLHLDFGREDLNIAFKKVEDKINEIIKQV